MSLLDCWPAPSGVLVQHPDLHVTGPPTPRSAISGGALTQRNRSSRQRPHVHGDLEGDASTVLDTNGTQHPASPPILAEAEAARRMLALAELQTTLAARGVRSVLARNHRLVLRYNEGPCTPSGLTDPALHVLAPDGTSTIATTDGTAYRLASGAECTAGDPAAAADLVLHAAPRA